MLSHMGHTLTRTLPTDPGLEPNPVFNVLIAYEDFETGKHAKRTFDFLVEHLGHDCQLNNLMWKFDVLSIPKLREIAVRDATQTDILIISSHGDPLPHHVIKWLESWLIEGTRCLALVALCAKARNLTPGSLGARDYLAAVARRANTEFFAQPDEWPGALPPHDRLRAPLGSDMAERTLSTLAGVVERDVATPGADLYD